MLISKPLTFYKYHIEPHNTLQTYNVTLCGSMRKYLDLFNNVIKTAKEQSINILSPQAGKKISEIDGFVRTDGDPKISDKELEVHHIEAITKSDLVFIINPSGVVGKTTFAEIITTEFFGKPILFLEKIDDSEEKIIKDIYNSNIFYQNVLNTHRSIENKLREIRRIIYNIQKNEEYLEEAFGYKPVTDKITRIIK